MSNKPGRVPTIYNKTMTSADTEYSQDLPDNTCKYLIKCRETNDVKLAFTSGDSGTTYVTIPAGMTYWEDEVDITKTLYFQCAAAGKTAEIIAWTY